MPIAVASPSEHASVHLPAEPRQTVVLARNEFVHLDVTEGRDLVQRRAEMDRPFERGVVCRVGVQADGGGFGGGGGGRIRC